MLFQDIPGCEEVKTLLIQAANQRTIPHAMLFKGNAGGANMALAVAFATYLHCTDKQEHDSCGICPACHKMERLSHPDFNIEVPVYKTEKMASDYSPTSADFLSEIRSFFTQHIYGDVNQWRLEIKTDKKQLRYFASTPARIQELVSLTPYEGEYKIVVIWLPEYLELAAANGLLKTLEEPPKNTLFFMVAVDLDEMLATILSRVQIINVPIFTDEQVKQYLIDELEVEPKKAEEVAFIADGSIQEATLLLERETDEFYPFFSQWMRNCYAKNYKALVKDANTFHDYKNRETQMSFLLYSCHMIRQALLFHAEADVLVKLAPEERLFIQKFSASINEANGAYIYEQLSKAYDNTQRNSFGKLTFLDMSLYVCSALGKGAQ
jgi:DNA polymerase III subunit delta'